MSAESDTAMDAEQFTRTNLIRSAHIDNVDFSQRIITVIAVPYEQETFVPYRGETWGETIARGAFDGVLDKPHRIRANRDHDKTRTVGKVVQFHRDRTDGLVSDIRIAKTPLGDETLALADEDCLGASVGGAVLPRDLSLDRSNKTRRVNRAFLDHIAFVEDPAYQGAKVLAVRDGHTQFVDEAELPPLPGTPNLDQAVSELRDILAYADARLNKK